MPSMVCLNLQFLVHLLAATRRTRTEWQRTFKEGHIDLFDLKSLNELSVMKNEPDPLMIRVERPGGAKLFRSFDKIRSPSLVFQVYSRSKLENFEVGR